MANTGDNSQVTRVAGEVWWLDGGTEQCERCLQRYAYEIEVRCVACDAPLCPHCAVVVMETRESFCPGCEEE